MFETVWDWEFGFSVYLCKEMLFCLIFLFGFRVRDLWGSRHRVRVRLMHRVRVRLTASSPSRFSSPAFRRFLCSTWTIRSGRPSLSSLLHPCPLGTSPSILFLPLPIVSTVLWGTSQIQVLCKFYLLIFPLFFSDCCSKFCQFFLTFYDFRPERAGQVLRPSSWLSRGWPAVPVSGVQTHAQPAFQQLPAAGAQVLQFRGLFCICLNKEPVLFQLCRYKIPVLCGSVLSLYQTLSFPGLLLAAVLLV